MIMKTRLSTLQLLITFVEKSALIRWINDVYDGAGPLRMCGGTAPWTVQEANMYRYHGVQGELPSREWVKGISDGLHVSYQRGCWTPGAGYRCLVTNDQQIPGWTLGSVPVRQCD